MEKTSVRKMVYDYIEHMTPGTVVGPREIKGHIFTSTAGMRNPMDSTITRFIRLRRNEFHDIVLESRSKSLYRKIQPEEEMNEL